LVLIFSERIKLKYSDNDLHELQQISYNYSLYRTGDFTLSDEVSMKTIGLFLLKADEIENDNATKWIVNTSKIHFQSHFRITKQDQDNIKKYQHDLLEKITNNFMKEKDEDLRFAFKDSLNTLTNDEMKTILFYFQCNMKIKILFTILEISYPTLRKKITRIKRKLKAETFKKLGVIVTKKFVSPQIDFLIINF